MSLSPRRYLPFVCLLMLIVLWVQTFGTSAHGYVVRSIPEDRATLERPPTRLQYWFSESLEPNFSEIHLRNAEGDILLSGSTAPDDDTLLTLQIPVGTLEDGAYIVELRPAFASDSHVVVESRVFFIGEAVAGVEGQSASTLPNVIEILWKTALYSGTFLLFGVFMVYAYVLVPTWGNAKYAQGLPPRLMRSLTRIIWVSVGVVVVAHIAALLHQTTAFFNTSLAQVLTGGLWDVVRIGSRFGDVWNVRTFLLVILIASMGAAHYYGGRFPRAIRSFWTANVWVMALMLGAPAVSSHIAGSLIMPWVGVMVHWLHTLSVAFWLGGVVLLTLILPIALRPYEGDVRRQALLAVMRRFSFYVVASVALVVTTGIYSATNWFFTPSDVVTTYGGALGVKLLMVGLLLWVGALHHMALRPAWLARVPFMGGWVARADGFAGTMRLESGLALGALLLASVLSATPIPEPDFARVQVETPQARVQVDDVTIDLTISPGGVGINTFDALILRDGAPLEDVRVDVQVVQPEGERRSAWQTMSAVDAGLYVNADDAINATGTWWTLIDVRLPGADGNPARDRLIRGAFAWDISDEATVLQSRPPAWWHVLSAFGVLGALIFALMPWGRRVYARLDLSPVAVTVALGGSVIFLALTVFGVWVIVEQQARIEAQRNPPARIVNSVLPSADSLARGEVLYNEHCIIMQTVSDFNPLLRQLDTLRDDDLFDVIGQGWRDVPPCDAEFDEGETWDVVNYLRTFRVRVVD